MKGVKVFTLIVFFAMIAVPLALFNFKPDAVSDVDNRKLAPSPFSASADNSKRWTVRTEEFVNDRIGLRNQMLQGYCMINDLAFHKMAHPSYSYGKNSYVFGAGVTTEPANTEYITAFTDALLQMQAYCKLRNVPFVVMLDPSKASVMTDKLPSSVNYNTESTDALIAELDKKKINYVNNIEELTKLYKSGTQVFNKKYDANHWNYTGAFYGTQNCLKNLQKSLPKIHLNTESEFNVTQKTQKYLPLSRFPVNESVPDYELKDTITDITDKYKGLKIDEEYNAFKYFVNDKRKAEGCPRALVFQGSYMNIYGDKFFKNSFSEYIMVHGYQNSLDLPYYFGMFKPDCVVFEVAEYTIKDAYYSQSKMTGLKFNRPLSSLKKVSVSQKSLPYDSIDIKKSGEITTVEFKTEEKYEQVWVTFEGDYDMVKTATGYAAAVPTSEKDKDNVKMTITTLKDAHFDVYS